MSESEAVDEVQAKGTSRREEQKKRKEVRGFRSMNEGEVLIMVLYFIHPNRYLGHEDDTMVWFYLLPLSF